MKIKGKIVQIIKNKELKSYFSGDDCKQAQDTGKDVVVLSNPNYPNGFKGYFMSFKKNKPHDVFPILMDSSKIKEGDIVELSFETFKYRGESDFYFTLK